MVKEIGKVKYWRLVVNIDKFQVDGSKQKNVTETNEWHLITKGPSLQHYITETTI